MEFPNSPLESKSIRPRAKWIGLSLLFVGVLLAVAYPLLFQVVPADEHLVYLDEKELRHGKDVLCPMVVNPKDGLPDYPDSVWMGNYIAPLRERMEERKDLETSSFRIQTTPTIPFATLRAVLLSMQYAGVTHVELVDSQGNVPVRAKFEVAFSVFGGRLDGGPFNDSFALLMERNDSLVFVAYRKSGISVRFATLNRVSSSGKTPLSIQDSLVAWKTLAPAARPIDLLVDPLQTSPQVCRISRLALGINGAPPRLAQRPRQLEDFLTKILDTVGGRFVPEAKPKAKRQR
ncbi:MAG: hypothetical protein IPN71_08585 [Fibrobacteres bacterium]|jgi:hypothetical protein|nr:hypothetical protein [Fibrobacterota bacterium]